MVLSIDDDDRLLLDTKGNGRGGTIRNKKHLVNIKKQHWHQNENLPRQ